MGKTAVLLMLITIISKVTGFLREIILSYFYGASNITDIYLISQTIPITIFGLISNGIATGYIPMYSRIEVDHGTKEANKYTSNLTNIIIIACTVLIAIGLVFTEPLVRIFALGFDVESLALAVKFTRITLFGMYSIGLVAIFSGFLQIKGRQVVAASIGLPMNIIIILAIIISSRTNVVYLVIGSLIGTLSQFFLLIPATKKIGYVHRPTVDIKDKYIKQMAFIALPIILGSSADQISGLIDRTLASRIAEGGITALSYAGKIIDVITGLFVLTVIAIVYPTMSKMAAKEDFKGLKTSVSEAITTINILIIPSTIGVMVFSKEIIGLLFNRGAFTAEAFEMTTGVLFFYAVGIVGFGLRHILFRVFYSMQNTRTPVINTVISVMIDIVLNVVLSKYMGINGLALSSSISAIICAILLFISLRKEIGPYGLKNISISFAKILFASIIMGLVARLFYGTMSNQVNSNLALILAIGVGAIVYGITMCFMKIDEIDSLVETAKEKIENIKK